VSFAASQEYDAYWVRDATEIYRVIVKAFESGPVSPRGRAFAYIHPVASTGVTRKC